MPSTSDSRQPYRLSNLLLVTESLTLMAGKASLPSLAIWYSRFTPVVASSVTPLTCLMRVEYHFGSLLSRAFMAADRAAFSSLAVLAMMPGSVAALDRTSVVEGG